MTAWLFPEQRSKNNRAPVHIELSAPVQSGRKIAAIKL
jgi:hypothetical protein